MRICADTARLVGLFTGAGKRQMLDKTNNRAEAPVGTNHQFGLNRRSKQRDAINAMARESSD
jgi:hypothetical protein